MSEKNNKRRDTEQQLVEKQERGKNKSSKEKEPTSKSPPQKVEKIEKEPVIEKRSANPRFEALS